MPRDEAAPPSNPMRHGRIPNNKLQNPHTIAAREQFRTKPRRSPRRHRESQRLDRRERKAAAADRAATSKNREGTAVALPDPISAAKNQADAVPFSTVHSILGRRVDTQGAEADESSTSAFGESNNDSDAVDPNYPELGRGRRGDTQGAESDESSTSAFGEAHEDSDAVDPDHPESGRRRW